MGLLAEESIALVDYILDNFGPRSPIFDTKRAIHVSVAQAALVCVVVAFTQLLLLSKLSDTVLSICSPMRCLLVVLLNA